MCLDNLNNALPWPVVKLSSNWSLSAKRSRSADVSHPILSYISFSLYIMKINMYPSKSLPGKSVGPPY